MKQADMNVQKIETEPRPYCPACESTGNILYRDLTDRLFGVPGTWNMKKCVNKKCGTLWLDPTPKETEIIKLYRNYHTHTNPVFTPYTSPVNTVLYRIRSAYLHEKYGYRPISSSRRERLWRFVANVHPGWRDIQAANIYYFPANYEGLLLDVGSGNGDTLRTMSNIGWKCIGIDFDKDAVDNAKKQGLDVRYGDLFTQKFEDNGFDAVLINHVIEHVSSPKEMIRESQRILKKDGVLVATTPNVNALGHIIYKKNWRGLETPQHLQLFTPSSLYKVAQDAGFSQIKTFSSLQGAFHMLDASAKLAKGSTAADSPNKSNTLRRILEHVRWFFLGWMHVLFPNHDEMLILVCKK